MNVNEVSLSLSLSLSVRDISLRRELRLRGLKKLRVPHAYNNSIKESIKEKNEEYLSTVDKR